jgi:hypothetical protein
MVDHENPPHEGNMVSSSEESAKKMILAFRLALAVLAPVLVLAGVLLIVSGVSWAWAFVVVGVLSAAIAATISVRERTRGR